MGSLLTLQVKMSSKSQQIVKNDSSDFSNNHHAMVAPNITPTVARLDFHKMISVGFCEPPGSCPSAEFCYHLTKLQLEPSVERWLVNL